MFRQHVRAKKEICFMSCSNAYHDLIRYLDLPESLITPVLHQKDCNALLLSALENWPGTTSLCYAAACTCFYCFQKLHQAGDAASVLLGDYYFAQFSSHLMQLDSPVVVNRFSQRLRSIASEPEAITPKFVRQCDALNFKIGVTFE